MIRAGRDLLESQLHQYAAALAVRMLSSRIDAKLVVTEVSKVSCEDGSQVLIWIEMCLRALFGSDNTRTPIPVRFSRRRQGAF